MSQVVSGILSSTLVWIFGKRILLPVGYCHDAQARRIYALGILNQQSGRVTDTTKVQKVQRSYEE